MHVMLLMATDSGNFGSAFWIGIAGLVLTVLSILVAIGLAAQDKKYKILTHETLSDTAIINASKDLGQDVQLFLDGHVANDMRLVYLKLVNAGNAAIAREDYELPELDASGQPTTQHALLLDFGEHKVIRFALHGAEPESSIPRNTLDNLLQQVGSNQLKFQGVGLNSKNALFVKVICLRDMLSNMTVPLASLSNKEREVRVKITGQIKEGEIKEYIPTPPRITPGRIKVGVSLFLAVISFFVSFNGLGFGALLQGQCGLGSIQDNGSTAFYSTALQEAQTYHSTCVLGSIEVDQSNSSDGLVALEHGQIQIANSELFSPYPDLQDHAIAGIVFTLIVNKQVTGITNLSSAQIQQIYNGEIRNWNQISSSAPNLPIVVFERPSGSGTLGALVKYVLGEKDPQLAEVKNVPDSTSDVVNAVTSTPGAIGYVALSSVIANGAVSLLSIDGYAPSPATVESGSYKFWAIEHMYTKQNPDQLVSSFISFVKANVPTGGTFINLSDIPPSIQQTR